MLRIKKNNKGVSIVEVVVASLTFGILVFGVFSSLTMMKPMSQESISRLGAMYVGKSVLERLKTEVQASTWDTGRLRVGSHSNSIQIYGINHNVNYDVSDVPGLNLRKVVMNISY